MSVVLEYVVRTLIAYLLLTTVSYFIITKEQKGKSYLYFETLTPFAQNIIKKALEDNEKIYQEAKRVIMSNNSIPPSSPTVELFMFDVCQEAMKRYDINTLTISQALECADIVHESGTEEIKGMDLNKIFDKTRKRDIIKISIIPFIRLKYILKIAKLNSLSLDEVERLVK